MILSHLNDLQELLATRVFVLFTFLCKYTLFTEQGQNVLRHFYTVALFSLTTQFPFYREHHRNTKMGHNQFDPEMNETEGGEDSYGLLQAL